MFFQVHFPAQNLLLHSQFSCKVTSFFIAFLLVNTIHNQLSWGKSVVKRSDLNFINQSDAQQPFLLGDDILTAPWERAGLIDQRYRWPDSTVPYEIDMKFDPKELSVIHKAMSMISEKTCIRFKRRQNEKDYLFIKAVSSGCSSYVGRIGGRQLVMLQRPTCSMHMGSIGHELIHALGFEHETSRPDRDDYVVINWSNIDEKYRSAFTRFSKDRITDFNVPYDYTSIMHYPGNAFAKSADIPTIIPKHKNIKLMYPNYVSEWDALKINRMYNCDVKY